MQFFTEVDPIYEAFVYLNGRITEYRLNSRIEKLKLGADMMNDEYRAFFERIVALEGELDREFMPDELIAHYFRPLRKVEENPGDAPMSIGYALMPMPQPFSEPLSMDRIIDFYRNAELSTVLNHFYQRISTNFYPEPPEGISDLNGFMAFLDGVLAEAQAKWDLMDVVTNPIKHLEKLRPLVEGVAAAIERRGKDFRELIEAEKARFFSNGTVPEALSFIGHHVGEDELAGFAVFPSIFDFNIVAYIREMGAPVTTRMQLGLFVRRLKEMQAARENTKAFIDVLKLISDETRFKALHHMRNRYSYGQELADMLKCTRNTMYYHLDRLHGNGLIDIKVTDYRAFYRMNKKNVYEKLTALRDYLTDGWQPGDDEGQEDETEPEQE